jgi:5-methylcytosine-specific restriction enzyme A
MRLNDPSIASRLSAILGSAVSEEVSRRGAKPSYRLRSFTEPHGVSVIVIQEANSVRAELVTDPLAAELISVLGNSDEAHRAALVAALSACSNLGNLCRMRINGSSVRGMADFPGEPWTTFEASVTVPTLRSALDSAIVDGVSLVFGLFLILVGAGVTDLEFDEEGRKSRIEVNHYERSAANRAIAIAMGGVDCAVCGFNFQAFYGDFAAGYIEVHHILPVSLMGGSAPLDPMTDLVCLCANCHRAAHRTTPPLDPNELRERIERQERQPNL